MQSKCSEVVKSQKGGTHALAREAVCERLGLDSLLERLRRGCSRFDYRDRSVNTRIQSVGAHRCGHLGTRRSHERRAAHPDEAPQWYQANATMLIHPRQGALKKHALPHPFRAFTFFKQSSNTSHNTLLRSTSFGGQVAYAIRPLVAYSKSSTSQE